MAYMCTDSGNLMAIAQQVIQQQQQHQHQHQKQKHHHHVSPPTPSVPVVPPHAQIPATVPYGGGSEAWPQAEHFFSDVFGASTAADAVFSDLTTAADFDSDGWMET